MCECNHNKIIEVTNRISNKDPAIAHKNLIFKAVINSFQGMNPLAVLGFVTYILLSLTTIGMLFENRQHACIFELVRCLMFLSYVQRTGLELHGAYSMLQSFFILSSCFWLLKTFRILHIEIKTT